MKLAYHFPDMALNVEAMGRLALIELRDLEIAANIGTYGPQDVVPDAHILDLTLTISPDLVQIFADDMARVFDYDPLIAQINTIALSQKYETQEYLMTRIAIACAAYEQITAVDLCLRKKPVLAGTGSLGVRLMLAADDLAALRNTHL
jgi:dihydroneopterin aldolase